MELPAPRPHWHFAAFGKDGNGISFDRCDHGVGVGSRWVIYRGPNDGPNEQKAGWSAGDSEIWFDSFEEARADAEKRWGPVKNCRCSWMQILHNEIIQALGEESNEVPT